MEFNEFTSSCIQSFLDCRIKFKYQYIDLIAPRRSPWGLTDGSAFHLGMELRNSGLLGKEIIKKVRAEYDPIISDETIDEDATNDARYHREMIVGMVLGYLVGVKPDYEQIEPEKVVKFKIAGDNFLAMKCDGLCKKNGLDWVKEYKTTAMADMERYKGQLELNFQVDFYMYLLRRHTGKFLEGVLYEIVKKPLIKQKKNEEFEDYLKRVRKDYLKRPEFYYHKKYVYRSPQEIEKFEDELFMILIEMQRAIDGGLYYKNKGNCFKYGECPFKRLCFHSDPEVVKGLMEKYYRQKTTAHEELANEG